MTQSTAAAAQPIAEGPVLLSVEGGIAHIRLNRPASANGMSVELLKALYDAVDPYIPPKTVVDVGNTMRTLRGLSGAGAPQPVLGQAQHDAQQQQQPAAAQPRRGRQAQRLGHADKADGAEDDLEVVGEASDGAETLRGLARVPADVVLMDMQMPSWTVWKRPAGSASWPTVGNCRSSP